VCIIFAHALREDFAIKNVCDKIFTLKSVFRMAQLKYGKNVVPVYNLTDCSTYERAVCTNLVPRVSLLFSLTLSRGRGGKKKDPGSAFPKT